MHLKQNNLLRFDSSIWRCCWTAVDDLLWESVAWDGREAPVHNKEGTKCFRHCAHWAHWAGGGEQSCCAFLKMQRPTACNMVSSNMFKLARGLRGCWAYLKGSGWHYWQPPRCFGQSQQLIPQAKPSVLHPVATGTTTGSGIPAHRIAHGCPCGRAWFQWADDLNATLNPWSSLGSIHVAGSYWRY